MIERQANPSISCSRTCFSLFSLLGSCQECELYVHYYSLKQQILTFELCANKPDGSSPLQPDGHTINESSKENFNLLIRPQNSFPNHLSPSFVLCTCGYSLMVFSTNNDFSSRIVSALKFSVTKGPEEPVNLTLVFDLVFGRQRFFCIL